MLVTNIIYMAIWTHTSEVAAKRLREAYFASILRQDIAFFDDVGAGEVATRIETDTRKRFPSSCRNLVFISRYRSRSARYFRKDPDSLRFPGRFLHRFHPRLYQTMETRTGHVLHYPHDFHHVRSHEQVHLQVHAGIS